MARRRRRRKILRKAPIIITILLILAVSAFLLYNYGEKWFGISIFDNSQTDSTTQAPGDEVQFHFIDVGQGDAILITTKDGNMLIDSGDLSSGSQKKLDSYLKSQNIESFKYVVFTHTDADHIGSGDIILNNYEVGTVIMPDYQATSKVYGRVVRAIEKNEIDLVLIGEDEDCEKPGYTFKLGPITHTVMAPTKDFDDPNEMSVVIKSVYGETSVLLTGDAEIKSEKAVLAEYTDGELDIDILKAGHHGSSSSSSHSFLTATTPEITIISCGEGNKYGHPHEVVMDRLEKAEIEIYRTDLQGTIIVKTDGVTYTVETQK